jgi:hypothetical protein
MGIRTTNNSGSFELVPAGMHLARCYRVIDCGTHVDRNFGKRKRQGYLFWELSNTHRSDSEEPLIVAKRYTLSHNAKANLRIDLESWYGKAFDEKRLDDAGGFDLEKLIGRPALLNIVHSSDGKFANVASVNPLPAGMTPPAPRMEPLIFSMEPFDEAAFTKLSDNMQTYIKDSEEYEVKFYGPKEAPGRDGIIPPAGPAVPPKEDLPYGDPAPQSYRAPSKNPSGPFGDMPDDIPF